MAVEALSPLQETLEVVLVDTPKQLKSLLDLLYQSKSVAVDTEATGLSPWTAIPLTIQFGFPESGSLETRSKRKIPPHVVVLPAFTSPQLSRLWDLLGGTDRLIIGHNLSYDYKLLKLHYGVELERIYDTQLAEQMLTTGDYDNKTEWLRHLGLAYLTNKYLGVELSKEERKTFLEVVPDASWRPTESQVVYSALDVVHLHEIARQQSKLLTQEGLLKSAELRFKALPPICDVELRGMLIDRRAWQTFLDDQEEKRKEYETHLSTLLTPPEWAYRKVRYAEEVAAYETWERERDSQLDEARSAWEYADGVPNWGEFKNRWMSSWRETHPNPGKPKLDLSPINLRSAPQVKRAFAALGLDVAKVDKHARETLLRKKGLTTQQHEVLTTYDGFNKAAKVLSSFGESLLAKIRPQTGRLHTSYNIHLTETGRMSSYNPNFQNMPRNQAIRSAFVADPGCVVITADYKSQELAVSAALSRDKQMVADIMAGKDLYKELAAQVFGISVSEVTDDQRRMCKNAMLGITFGLSAVGMENRYFIPKRTGQSLLDEIRKRYPEFVSWSDSQVELAKEHGYVTTAAGTRRYFRNPEALGWKIGTEPRNAPVQGTAADICYRLVARLKQSLPSGSYVGNLVHDEVVGVSPESQAQEVEALIIYEMQQAFEDVLPFKIHGVRVGVDTHIAPCWTKG